MLISDMEAVLRNLDARVGRVEQICRRLLMEHLGGNVETLAVRLSDQMHRLSDLVERLDRGR